jgi:hypothetical protein
MKKSFCPSFPLKSSKLPGHHPAARLKVVSMIAKVKRAALLRVLKRVILNSLFIKVSFSEKSIPKYR